MAKVVRFVRVKETKGAFQYKEVSKTGEELGMADAVIGSLYLRKDKVKDCPKKLTVKLILSDDED